MNIPEEQMDAIFTQLVALIENKNSPQEVVAELKQTLEKAHIFDLDEGQGVLTQCITRLGELAKSYEAEVEKNLDKTAEETKIISKDILIYSSYIITFLQDLEEEGEIEIS
jgi:hypothetical protein